jgi:AcrR family transcriptional regulator
MINSVTQSPEPVQTRTRLSADDRRSQLLAIGLGILVQKPIHAFSLDDVARKARISRGLLFHYFPNKSDYFDAVLDMAAQRVLDNTTPDPDATPEQAMTQIVAGIFGQINRRRDFYLALLIGQGGLSMGGDRVANFRNDLAQRVMEVLGLDEADFAVTHAWIAYTEDRAVQWTEPPPAQRVGTMNGQVIHCIEALHRLVAANHQLYQQERRP